MNFGFVHGGAQGGWVWAETIAALDLQTNGASVALALDAPGCGAKRGAPTDGVTLSDVARELIADIERAQMRDVILVGHSQGGQAIAFMLALRPDLFSRVVYVSCSIPLPGQTVLEMMGRGAHGSNPDEVGWSPERLESGETSSAVLDADLSAAFEAHAGGDMWPMATYAETKWETDHLGAVPSTFVICLRDTMLPVAWQERFAQRFKAERLVRIDAGHQAMNTRPQALAEVLRYEASLGR